MADLSILVDEVRKSIKGCPEIEMEDACTRAMQEFCKESFYYEKTLRLSLVADQPTYSLELTLGEDELLHIRSVQFGDIIVVYVDPSTINKHWSIGGTESTTNDIRGYSFEPPFYITTYPTAVVNEVDALDIRAVLQTSDTATLVPEVLSRSYKRGISAGAISFLTSQSGQSWTNPQVSEKTERQFRYEINEAKAARLRGFNMGNLRVRPKSFLIG